jgi:hypothetical protein
MIVDPDFPDHWKTRLLVDSLEGDQAAPIYVIRLWAHCQNRRTSIFQNLTAAALKALCRYPGHPNKLESGLLASGFVRRDGEDLIVHEWENYNASLIANWTNGKKGGRPCSTEKKKPKENPRETHGYPMANPWRTDKIGVDRIGEDRIGEDKDPPSARESAVVLPTKEEVVEAAKLAGVPADVADTWFHETDGRPLAPDGSWTDKSGRPIARWQSALKAYANKWASNDAQRAARPMSAGARAKRGPSVWELQQMLEAAQKEVDRICANPSNKEQIPDSFDRRLKSEPAAQVKSLKARISEMRAELAGVERKEAA